MIYYFLPDPGIHGGVKVACLFIEILRSLGMKAVVALPGGRAPRWFASRAPVISQEHALAAIRTNDIVMITWPPDHERLKPLSSRMVCHCQGSDERMNPIFADREVAILTCWSQTAEYCRKDFGKFPYEVGISISSAFFFNDEDKADNLVAYMPRRGAPVARKCMNKCGFLDYRAIDGLTEEQTSRVLKRAGIYLATSEGEEFGLPALEAMAAGCLVLSVPVKGGMEYLHDGYNCRVAAASDLPEILEWIMRKENRALRDIMRLRAMAAAYRYRPALQREKIRRMIAGGELECLQ